MRPTLESAPLRKAVRHRLATGIVALLASGMAVSVPSRVGAAVFRVGPGGFVEIAAALSESTNPAIAPGDTIQVMGNGGSTFPKRLLIDKDITIQGGWRADFEVRDPSVYVTVVRDTTGDFEKAAIRVSGPVHVVLDGLQIVAGRYGVEALEGADLEIIDCHFRNQRNTAAREVSEPGGGIRMSGGTLRVERSQFHDIITRFPGAGLALIGLESAELDSCMIWNCSATSVVAGMPSPGAGLYALGVGSLVMERDTLTSSISLDSGGLLYAEETSVSIGNCKFSQGMASRKGGGLLFRDCPSVSIAGSEISSNTSSLGVAGGLAVEAAGSLSLDGCVISNNSCRGEGGGLWLVDSPFVIANCSFSTNHQVSLGAIPTRGGGAYVIGSEGTVRATTFSRERVTGRGGAWHQMGGMVEFRDCRFEWNESGMFGGALYIGLSGVSRAENSLFAGNAAKLGGAFSASFTGRVEAEHCTISDGSATGTGAAVYLDTGATARLTNSILCCASAGNLIYCSAASSEITYCDVWNDDAVNGRKEFAGSCAEPPGSARNLRADPLFCDPAGSDYRLQPSSPCVGAASDGGDIGWAGVGCAEAPSLSLRVESWGRIKAGYRSGR